MIPQLAVLALLIAGYALVAARLDVRSISPALAFVVIGWVASDEVTGLVSLDPGSEILRTLAELTLTLVLFTDASTIRARTLRRDALPEARLLSIGLLLTLLAGALAAWLLFPGMGLGVALLIGATLAPTDAALGQAVVTDRAVPNRIRRLLNVESGLNDGIATPFVLLAVSIAASEMTGSDHWVVRAVEDAAIGAAVGLGLGFGGGRLLATAHRRGWATPASRQLFVLMLAAASYLVAVSLTGNGFIAAFLGGLAFGAATKGGEEGSVEFTELQGSLLAIGVWTAFGLAIAGQLLGPLLDLRAIVFAVLSLTVLRMAPVALALVGLRFSRPSVLFIGWFGPRGLASIVFLTIGLDGLHGAGLDPTALAACVGWTVLLSVVLHGLSARPLAARFGRIVATLPAGSPELDDDEVSVEPRVARTLWSAAGAAGVAGAAGTVGEADALGHRS
ncbi:MAG: cation:proton antiporter [Chloroflexota bacterium]